jgi:hypothetical protein
MAETSIRVRFGLRGLVSFFPNAGVLVGYVHSEKDFQKTADAVLFVKDSFAAVGLNAWADKIFFERG